jgi:hypothetical protein
VATQSEESTFVNWLNYLDGLVIGGPEQNRGNLFVCFIIVYIYFGFLRGVPSNKGLRAEQSVVGNWSERQLDSHGDSVVVVDAILITEMGPSELLATASCL